MAQYTIEDIEIIRQKSGLSYEEAVNLLEYHNGSLARALVDLEKNGRLKDARNPGYQSHRSKGRNLFTYLYRMRLKVTKGNVTIVNLSSLFCILAFLMAFWVPMIGLIAALVLGYRISVERNSSEFSADSFETVVKNASSNVKRTVSSFAKNFEGAAESRKSEAAPQAQKEAPRSESAASGTTPVNVQFPDGGSVEVKENTDGFHEADIQ